MAARYNSYDSRSSLTSTSHSETSSSAAFQSNKLFSSKAIVRSKPFYLTKTAKNVNPDNPGSLTCMMKKLMEMKKSNSKSNRVELVIPEELKKTDSGRGEGGKSTLRTLQRNFFGKEKVKALTEVKRSTRTLSMVLRSERELLSMNKDQEKEIAEIKFQHEERNRELEKLKDLCLKQREEIKSLKSALLFPDGLNSQMQELTQARQIIHSLQQHVISLNGQLQCIAQDLAEVKANKYLSESCYWQAQTAQTSSYDSLEFSSGSPDRLALEDLNPCLTPYTKTKPKEFERVDSTEESLSGRSTVTTTTTTGSIAKSSSKSVKLSRSSEGKAGRQSEESK